MAAGAAEAQYGSSQVAAGRLPHLVDPGVARPAVHGVGAVGVGVQHILHSGEMRQAGEGGGESGRWDWEDQGVGGRAQLQPSSTLKTAHPTQPHPATPSLRSLDAAVEVDAAEEGVVPALRHPLKVLALGGQHNLAVVVAACGGVFVFVFAFVLWGGVG